MASSTPQAQLHVGSYYAASVTHETDYPGLKGDQSADVTVIGAGFSGISTALFLAERGYKVCVVEANKVGWGASGRNGGQIIGGISGEQKLAKKYRKGGEALLWDMRWAGHDIIRQRVEQYQIDCDLKWGYVDVAIKPRHLRDQEADYQMLEKHQFPHHYEHLARDEIASVLGTDAYLGGLLNMGNGHVHPLNLCIGEARAAVSLGARIFEQSPVVKIEPGVKARVVTQHGSVSSDFVVLAGNAYHFVEPKLKGHLFPVNSFIVATEPLSDEQIAEINPRDLAVCDPNYILEYFRLSSDKRLLFGGRLRYFGLDPDIIKSMMMPKLRRIYPQLHKLRIDYAWGGTIGVTVNRVPQLGKLSNNVLYTQGYSGHGINVTHLAGQIMADAVAGTLERFDVFSSVKPIVIPGAHRFSKPMVSMGMMYYWLKDRL